MKLIILFLVIFSFLEASKLELEVLSSPKQNLSGEKTLSYLIWIDNRAKIMINMGSDSMLSLRASKAKLEDLELLVFSNLDPVSRVDLPLLVEAEHSSKRVKAVDVMVASGEKNFPSLDEVLNFSLIEIKDLGMSQYDDFKVSVIRIHQGKVPALAIRIDVDGKSIVISSETKDQSSEVELLAQNADLFVLENTNRSFMIAKIAKSAQVKKILLREQTAEAERVIKKEIAKQYKGEVLFLRAKMRLQI
jgi:molybdopterin-binding protein